MKKTGAWNPDWCNPCVYKMMPEHVWGLWEFMAKVMAPVAAGMTAVYDIDINKFNNWFKRSGIKDEYYDELYDILSSMLNIWQSESRKEHAGFDPKDIELLTGNKIG